ncbi:DUF192 domain-containing protein [Ningiella sp. W23]|uniref:DUF192 domain-containing protein n=1 Tax=Ningiella sp. W23 TaxID=3023715 RepID=UPI00375719E8
MSDHDKKHRGVSYRLLFAIGKINLLIIAMYFCANAFALEENNSEGQSQYEEGIDTVTLAFGNDVNIEVEYADEPHERQLGLMYRRQMCEDCGMLFKFDSVRVASIWMKNTYIPLDLAYINAFGKIIDIKQLVPHDLTSVPSSMPVLYALEMNEGWFAANGIKEGDKVSLPASVKP